MPKDEKNVAVDPAVAPQVEETKDEPLFTLSETLLSAKSNGGGKKIRPGVGYTIDGRLAAKAAEMPNQARMLVVLMAEKLTKAKPVISEPEWAKVLETAKEAGRLETTQDSWRIWQYYRPRLEEAKIVVRKSVTSVATA